MDYLFNVPQPMPVARVAIALADRLGIKDPAYARHVRIYGGLQGWDKPVIHYSVGHLETTDTSFEIAYIGFPATHEEIGTYSDERRLRIKSRDMPITPKVMREVQEELGLIPRS